ncbi:MAG: hypothetical protein ACSHWW_10725 [Nonlabens sp.]|uniref:hypothetical protein n=1 Tax=Nonlabens sp. TaxID=1888209 RepID=UPI003EF13D5D
MKLLKTIDLVLARFGNIRAMERTHVDDFTENLIDEITGYLIADCDQGELFADFQELVGYEFLNLSVLSSFPIKTIKGATLDYHKNNKTIHLIKSDTKEIESDYSNVSNRYITKIDFILSKEEKEFIYNPGEVKVDLLFKKQRITFTTFKIKN